jgi:hypothetical protein
MLDKFFFMLNIHLKMLDIPWDVGHFYPDVERSG